MNKKFIYKASALTLGVGLVSSSLLNTYTSFSSKVHAAEKITKAEQILASLSKEERDALTKLQVSESDGLHGFDEKELHEDKDIPVIVEFKSMPEKVAMLDAAVKGKELTGSKAKDNVNKEHSTFEADLERILPQAKEKGGKKSYKITRSFKTAYNGVSMNLPAKEVKTLLQSDAVKAVYKSATVSIELPTTSKSSAEEESTKRIESIPFLGVDKLHNEGITGKGVKVGVIDTGIDYHHPDLQDAYKGGYDFVDNDNDPMETTYDDWIKAGSPAPPEGAVTYYTDHGTHVSGTIAGRAKNSSGIAAKGIAPDSELYGYRVLGPYGTGGLDAILAGIDRAVSDGMDVINLSLGIDINDPQYPTSTAINNAVLNGVTAVVSAGNSGPSSYTLGSPGAAALALTVGASSTPITVAKYTGVLEGVSNKSYNLSNLYSDFISDLKSFNQQSMDIVDLGVGLDSDYKNKDVNGKWVLVNTGTLGTQTKVTYAKAHGALGVIAYNNIPNAGPTNFVREDQNFIPTFSMSYEQGLDFKAQIAAGHNKLTFKDYTEGFTDGDKLAYFSSRGPSRQNYDMKPEITAPGVSVLSTVPAYDIYKNDPSNYQFAYNRMSGTSMAAPHVTGISALLLQANPKLQPGDIKTILMNTAKPLADKYSVFEVGAGRVDPYQAVHTGMEISVEDKTPITMNGKTVNTKEVTGGLSYGSIYAGEDASIKKMVNFRNFEDKAKKFDIAVNYQKDAAGSLDANSNEVKLVIPTTISVEAFESTKIPVSIKVPATAKPGVYEGYLIITNQSDKNEQYRVPFSVRTTEEGIDSTGLSTNVISPYQLQETVNSSATWHVRLNFKLKSQMKWLDLVVVDGKTGQDIGYLESIPVNTLYDGTNYFVERIFEGKYYAFTGDPDHPISSKVSYAKPGYYKIKMIGTSERDNIFTSSNDIYVDPFSPTITTSLDGNESPVVNEYQPGVKTVPVQVKVFDNEVDKMVASGMDVNQSINTFNYSINGNRNPVLPVGNDGIANFNLPISETASFTKFTVNGLDGAKNSSPKKNYYFVKAGTPYASIMSDKTNVKMGETVSTTLHLNNVQKIKTAEWTLSNIGTSFEIVEAKGNEGLASYGDYEVTVSTTGNTSKVKLVMNGTSTISGNLTAINLKLKAKDTSFTLSTSINPTLSCTDELGKTTSVSSTGMDFKIQPTFSEIFGTLRGYGVALTPDWTKLGASIRIIDADGNVYDGTSSIGKGGDYRISKLPITDKPFTWEMKLPGHFTMKRQIQIGFDKNGSISGQLLLYYNGMAGSFYDYGVAGDVNQDNVVDILDALYIQTYWGSDKREADINFDGKVSAKDLEYVELNYLKQNMDVDNAPKPLKKFKSATLESIKRELGIQ
ncbi:S8 family serine peptidase [Bacillus sp. AL-1R]